MKRTCAYTAVCVLLVIAGTIWAKWLPFEQQETSSILFDQAATFAPFLPEESVEMSIEVPVRPAVSFALDILPAPTVLVSLELPSELSDFFAAPKQEQSIPEPAITQQAVLSQPPAAPKETANEELIPVSAVPVPSTPSASAAPSYLYFYTGVPVRSAPMLTTVSSANGFTTVTVTPPVIQSYAAPVFVPQTVSSRVGAPKWVYSNGVVIKPKVYFPHQPVRNSLRATTP